jgi:PAS domain S-box-containing protein
MDTETSTQPELAPPALPTSGDDAALIRQLAPAILEASTVEDAIELTLREICAHTGWVMGQAWKRNGSPFLECYPCWCTAAEQYRAFRVRSQSLTFRAGEGLPGSAWSTKRPVWVTDVGSRPDLPRGPFAREVGITAGLAVPVLAQGDVVGVLEFFMTEAVESDERMIGLVTAAAAQLGALIRRRQAEEAVHVSEEGFRQLVDSIEDCAIFKLDTDGGVASWNSGAQRISGYRPSEIVGYHVSRFYTSDDVLDARPELHLEQARANGRFEEAGWRVRADGSRFWASVVIAALHDSGGRLRGFCHVIRDATAQRSIEGELHWLRAVLEGSDDAIIGLTPQNGIISTWNSSAERLFGYSAREMIGRSVHQLVPADQRDRMKDALEHAGAGEVVRYDTMALRKNDSQVDMSVAIAPVHDHSGATIGVSMTAKDVTDDNCVRRRVERTLGAYLDPGVAGQILDDCIIPAAAETDVTILFLDICGFTALADGAEPQKVVDTLNRLFELAVPVVIRHGGHVDKFIGDGLLAVFGAQVEGDDQADSAMRAALEIERRTASELDGELRIGIGVHTGRVVVGNVGGGGRLDFTVIGDAVNTAARIEAATRRTGDTILFSAQTRARLGDLDVPSMERPAVKVKGKREPLPLYAPVASHDEANALSLSADSR